MNKRYEVNTVYDQLRALGISAQSARSCSQRGMMVRRIPFNGKRGSFIVAGARVSVVLREEVDGWDIWGREVYGRFMDERTEGAIRTMPGSPTRWFLPAMPYWTLRKQMASDKIGRTEADRIARKIVHSARLRAAEYAAGNWCYQRAVITVKARGRVCVEQIDGLEWAQDGSIEQLSGVLFRQAERMARSLEEAA